MIVNRRNAIAGVRVFKSNERQTTVNVGCPLFPSLTRFYVVSWHGVAGVHSKYLVPRVTKESSPLYVWGHRHWDE